MEENLCLLQEKKKTKSSGKKGLLIFIFILLLIVSCLIMIVFFYKNRTKKHYVVSPKQGEILTKIRSPVENKTDELLFVVDSDNMKLGDILSFIGKIQNKLPLFKKTV